MFPGTDDRVVSVSGDLRAILQVLHLIMSKFVADGEKSIEPMAAVDAVSPQRVAAESRPRKGGAKDTELCGGFSGGYQAE